MTKIILKWPMDGLAMERTMLPGPVVAVAWQKGNVVIWIEHQVEAGKYQRGFEAIPTGVDFIGIGTHVGTAVSDDLVFHIYEIPR